MSEANKAARIGYLMALVTERDGEIERLRAALGPFTAEKLPSSRRTELAYNRHGLRCSMSPLQIAQAVAFAALSPADGTEA